MRRVNGHQPEEVRRVQEDQLVWQLNDLRRCSHARYAGWFAVERRVLLALTHLEVLHLRNELRLVLWLVGVFRPLGNRNAVKRSEDIVLVLIDAGERQNNLD